MPRADVTLPNGTKVQIEGTAEEIASLLEFYASRNDDGRTRRSSKVAQEKRIGSPRGQVDGPRSRVRILIEDGFFAEKRSLRDVIQALAGQGHIYPRTTLSATLISLTKKRELRRMKENGVWMYVNT